MSDYYTRFQVPPDIEPVSGYVRPPIGDSEVTGFIWNTSSVSMRHVPDGVVGLVITSPPYHVGMDYDDPDLGFDEWLDVLEQVFAECYRVMEPGAVICVNVANLGRRPYLRYNGLVADLLNELGFLQRGEIIWEKFRVATGTAWGTFGSAKAPVIRDVHEYVIVAQKGQFTRARDGESNVDKLEWQELTSSVWRIPPTNSRRSGHPAAFPVELPRRLIHLFSYVDDIILDPFMGSGATALAAEQCGRDWIGYEIDLEYALTAQKRILEARQGRGLRSIFQET